MDVLGVEADGVEDAPGFRQDAVADAVSGHCDYGVLGHGVPSGPASVEPQLFLAKAHHLEGAHELAESIFERLFEKSSDERKAETALWITTTYNSLWDYQRALDWMRYIGNERLEARLTIYFLFRLGRTEEAIDLGRKLVEGNSRDPIALYLFGLVLFNDLLPHPESERKQKLFEVTQVVNRALEIKAEFPPASRLLKLAEGERKRIMDGPSSFHATAWSVSSKLCHAIAT